MSEVKKCCATCQYYHGLKCNKEGNGFNVQGFGLVHTLYCDDYKPAPPVPPEPVLRPPALAICSCCEGIGVAEQVLGEPGWKVRCSLGLCDIRTKDHRTRYEAHVAWNEGEQA